MNPPAQRIAVLGVALLLVGGVAIGAALVGTARDTDASAARPAPRFVDEASAAGLEHRYDGDFTHFVGGGVAVLDCDDDGRPDLYLAGGERPAALYRNRSAVGGALDFERVPHAATDLSAVVGAYPLDVDGDGHTDLAVLRIGENALLRGTGDCAFEPANEDWGFDGGASWSTAFSATWEAGEELPTLAVGNYLLLDEDGSSTFTCDEGELHRPEGDRYGEPATLAPGWCPLSMLFSDWDRSGRRDLRVSNDRHYYRDGQEQLWRLEPREPARPWTADDGWRPLRIWGMGIATRDLTGDGYPEVYLTSQGDNKLQTLADPGSGAPSYDDIALRRGVTAHRPYAGDTTMPSTAWHPEFGDVNNDGHVDLFVSKGNVEAQTDHAARDPSNLLIGQADGTFVEGAEAAGVMSYHRARGAALTDLNLDGLLDLVVVNRREPVALWRNVGGGTAAEPVPMGHWLALRLVGDGANRDAIGAWVEVRANGRVTLIETTVGGGHVSGQLGWLHIGLGQTEDAEVTVTWPDGRTGPVMRVEADGFAIIRQDATTATPWMPPSTEEDE
ncbi:MAG TPA: CRTAC1 family protein [Patescibacteria group bacterium]|nr:CRTAC1 family protein [Patescibacteria group bacterium]